MDPAKPRRLRASCDGCFSAKVKCSKGRPMCQRCLQNGLNCHYSESSRAGKPKSDQNARLQHTNSIDLSATTRPAHQGGGMGMFDPPVDWVTPPYMEGEMSRNHSMTGQPMLSIQTSQFPHADSTLVVADMHTAGMPWSPQNDLPSPFDISGAAAHMGRGHDRTPSNDMNVFNALHTEWSRDHVQEAFGYRPAPLPTPSMPTTAFPTPATTPLLRAGSRYESRLGSPSSCTCYTACLQSLQAFRDASSNPPPALDSVLNLNRKALEGCAMMLGCQRCMARPESTVAKVLGTVLSEVVSSYNDAYQMYFANTASPNGVGLSIGTYTLPSEQTRWLELEVLAWELDRVHQVYTQYRENYTDVFTDSAMTNSIIEHVGHNLDALLTTMECRRGGRTAYA
ncbi:hypothetical protein QBC47DRAFT_310933 [Echria macrotheca]|uniref:Zn(2)-C6 fungal-type domain-containing protein n=1 Tax=Echria macrotheca TaxID=438768 RepID=A0AAJ0F0C5_9PEZI|nr:hypothetical protein QBC47DRAFT_310933 [Echria macrotheca]